MRRTNQGGSVLGFILVASVLALILVGALYVVKQQSQQRQRTTPQNTPVATSPAPTTSSSPSAPVSPAAPTPAKTTPAQQSAPSSHTPATSSSTDSVTADTLPHTGPSETVIALISVGLLSGSVIAYARSRRVILSF